MFLLEFLWPHKNSAGGGGTLSKISYAVLLTSSLDDDDENEVFMFVDVVVVVAWKWERLKINALHLASTRAVSCVKIYILSKLLWNLWYVHA